MARTTAAQVFLDEEEKAELEALAAAEGVSVSLFLYRRAFNKPDANHRVGRPPKPRNERSQTEQLDLGMTG